MKLLLLICILGIANSQPFIEKHDELGRTIPNVPEYIEQHGYQGEEHFVTTSDGYILRVHRVLPKTGVTPKNQIVFLMHGILNSSIDWLLLGPGRALAYLLSDLGYDVWMGNARGNTQSRNHTHLNPDKNKAKFWDFSWDEIGYYDLPAMIDFVLEKTGHSDLIHIGHSQGTTSFYVMASRRPEYNAKIKAHFSLAPIAYMNHLASPFVRFFAIFTGPIEFLLNLIGVDEFLPSSDLMEWMEQLLCRNDTISQALCSNALFLICGFSPNEMDAGLLPELVKYTPAGAASKQFIHYAQEIQSGHFRRYDYHLGNMFHYGSLFPPDYKLKQITAPIYLFYSHNDWMAAETDVLRLYKALPNAQGRFVVADGSFNHLDYTYGKHAREYVYDRVISLMANICN